MFVRVSGKKGFEYVYLCRSVRVGKTIKQEIVEKLGKLSELTASDPDALKKLKEKYAGVSADRQSDQRKGCGHFELSAGQFCTAESIYCGKLSVKGNPAGLMNSPAGQSIEKVCADCQIAQRPSFRGTP